MSSINNSSEGWQYLKSMADKLGGAKNISDADLKKLLMNADSDGDGLISVFEFKEEFLNSDKYKDLEDDFLKAFEAIAKGDGKNESISDNDISDACEKAEDAAQATEEADSSGGGGGADGGGGSSGGGGGSNGTNGTNSKEPTAETAISRSDLEGKDIQTLQNDRGELLTDIGSLRSEKETAVAESEAQVTSLKESFDQASAAFADLIDVKSEADEAVRECAQNVLDMESNKNDVNDQVSTQQATVDEASALVSTV
ncbi:MAG: hypothetical protein E7Z90_07320, partial [Cyanobacteria bacterium SIG29]|nr:hypothetical protein [Cyanobacteria bacterium SIG29]